METQDDDIECLFCHKPIKQHTLGRPRKFCSDKCRNTYWAFHCEDIQHTVRRTPHEHECKYCGKKFVVYYRKPRKYCSHKCYCMDRYGKYLTK